jgi:hypothetical protein
VRGVVLAAVVLGLGASPAGAESFAGLLGRRAITRPIGDALAGSIARALPMPAASPGVTFTFDPDAHAFRRATEVTGQLFLERAAPLGRGRWNFDVSYQWVKVDTLDGRDTSELRDAGPPIIDPHGRLFTVPRFALGLETHEVTLGATYGVTDDLDVNLTLPLLDSSLAVHALARRVADGGLQPGDAHGTAFGPGDLLARAKQRLVRGPWGDVAAGVVVRMPTGSADDFQGTGTWEIAPMLYATTPALEVGGPVRLRGYANGGVDLDGEDVDRSEGRFGAGLDAGLGDHVTLAVAFLGREPFAALARPGFFDLFRLNPQTDRLSRRPFLGLDRGRPSYYDLAVGGRVVLWRETLIGFANVLLPLNGDGFRSDVIPMVGVEAAF